MPKVSSLSISLQGGSDNTYYASWEFKETTKKVTSKSTSVKVGSYVKIKSGAKYYNGVSIPSWVMSDTWKVIQLKGDRAVLGKNKSGTRNIQSPINVKYLTTSSTKVSTSSTSSNVTKYLDHYSVRWYYDTGDDIWFLSSKNTDVETKYDTFSPPSNALRIKCSVKPVSKKHKVNKKEVSYWTGTWVSKTHNLANDPPEKPSAPTVVIDKYTLKATIENISDPKSDQIQFEVYSKTKRVKTATVRVVTCRASYSCSISAGEDYRVRCRAVNGTKATSTNFSEWSDFSSSAGTMPVAPKGITSLKAMSETSVLVKWKAVANADSYNVEYTTEKRYFDTATSEVKSISVDAVVSQAEATGLESGKEYFFRVQAVNKQGESAWTEIKSVVVGKKPAAPTTWSSTTTAITGEPLILYWVHNSEDGSSQTYADLELYIDGVKETHTIKNTADEEEKDKTSSYIVDTSVYVEGTKLQWRVRTAGITKEYGDWSIQRTVDIYAPATLALDITDVDGTSLEIISSFPFYITGLPGPSTQAPIGYHLVVTSNEVYETVDNVGNVKMVNVDEEVYSKYFDINEELVVEMSPSNIDLENNIGYTVTCVVSMNSGLTAESSLQFAVDWADVKYEPDAEIGIDEDTFSAYISPYCIDENEEPIEDVLLSIYRREFDGSFREIATGIPTTESVYVTDPHPSLDYARYRIVATSKTTGAVSYYDPPGYPVNGDSVIIQWDEEWFNFDATTEDELMEPPWTGSLISIPYNIDVSDNYKPDAALVEYIGRSYPVSYYGTQLGSTATWSLEVPKSDKDTLYSLRRLARWTGDVYVREPSGSGYWANITVSFSQKHKELTIPVSLSITRVEGGL